MAADHTLVVVFLRGAADGLNMVVPVEDDGYHRARPTLAVRKRDALPLDGFFGLNHALAELLPLYREGELAVLHGVGSEDGTRSHFEAQDLMERAGQGGGGWLARHLRRRPGPRGGALSAVAVGEMLPECLRGAPSATALDSLEAFSLGDGGAAFTTGIADLYAREQGHLGDAARDTLRSLARIDDLRSASYTPAAEYPTEPFAQGLKLVARLVKARLGLEAAAVDLDGWDTHFAQDSLMPSLMRRLAEGVAAFRRDLGGDFARVSLVVMTEFGRRVAENSALGTDHGRASIMLAAGGGIRGGRVMAEWRGLESGLLEGPGDLPVATDYRDVLAPVLARHWGAGHLPEVFPGHAPAPVALY
ncbi:MAG: DUF1501 domain-containing protein [Candidatus Sumerlaeia bacterium]|nr:DUF1501 domain-containing protein [Candidatus Sumerlaeia bacterium]